MILQYIAVQCMTWNDIISYHTSSVLFVVTDWRLHSLIDKVLIFRHCIDCMFFTIVTWVIITFPMIVLVFKVLLSLPPFSWRLASIRAGHNYSNKITCPPCLCRSSQRTHDEESDNTPESKSSPYEEEEDDIDPSESEIYNGRFWNAHTIFSLVA